MSKSWPSLDEVDSINRALDRGSAANSFVLRKVVNLSIKKIEDRGWTRLPFVAGDTLVVTGIYISEKTKIRHLILHCPPGFGSFHAGPGAKEYIQAEMPVGLAIERLGNKGEIEEFLRQMIKEGGSDDQAAKRRAALELEDIDNPLWGEWG